MTSWSPIRYAHNGDVAIAYTTGGTSPLDVLVWAPSLAVDPEAREWWGRLLRSGVSPSGLRAVSETYPVMDVRPLLGAIHLPTLVLYRTGDRVVPPALSRAVRRPRPGGQGRAVAAQRSPGRARRPHQGRRPHR